MPTGICPNCNQRYTYAAHSGDYVHDCSSTVAGSVVKNEDVFVLGDWTDYTGSATVRNSLLQGVQNRLAGTMAGILGYDSEELSRRGKRKSTHRQRAHYEYIEVKQ